MFSGSIAGYCGVLGLFFLRCHTYNMKLLKKWILDVQV